MICPHCHREINPAAIMGSKGGSTKGSTKRRNVDYAAIGRLGAEKRKANREEAEREKGEVVRAGSEKSLTSSSGCAIVRCIETRNLPRKETRP